MDYTKSDAFVVHTSTGNRMHQDVLPVTTAVTADDMNMVIWSLMEVLKKTQTPPQTFQKDDADSYTALLRAMRKIYGSVDGVHEGAGLVAYDPENDYPEKTLGKRAKQSVYLSEHGAKGDGIQDDTAGIQRAIDRARDGATIYGEPGAVYLLRKNRQLPATIYPTRSGNTDGEQPCLLINQRKHLTLDGRGATLLVDVHGQGVLDILKSQGIKVRGFKFRAPMVFPPIDGQTGRGEKGVVDAGYYDPAALAYGPARNNSRNTSGFSSGGYGGAFPRQGGGTGASWGTWIGGFIANSASAVFIDDASTDISVFSNDIAGFNEAGVQISSPLTASYGWAAVGRVRVYFNHIHDCYTAGIEYHNVRDLWIMYNLIENCGHPNASIGHAVIDPGYGIASNNGVAPENVLIQGNTLRGNRRKGVDAHSIDTINISLNTIQGSGYGVMLVNGSQGVVRNAIVTGNQISQIAYPASAQACGIYIERNALAGPGARGSVVVANNRVRDVGVPPGQVALFPGTAPRGIGILLSGDMDGANCSNNLIENSSYLGVIGLCVGFAGSDSVKGTFNSNEVRGKWANGLNNLAEGGANNTTVGNTIDLSPIAPYTSGQVGINGAPDRHFGENNINVPPGASFMTGTAQNLELVVKVDMNVAQPGVISYAVGFNQSKFVAGVASDANGLLINLSPGVTAQAVMFTQTSSNKAVRLTGGQAVDHVYVRSEANPVRVGFQVAGTDYPASQVKGLFTFRISI